MTVGPVPNAITAAGRALDRAVRRIDDAAAVERPWLPWRHEPVVRGMTSGAEQAAYAARLLEEHVLDTPGVHQRMLDVAAQVDRSWPTSRASIDELATQVRAVRDDVHRLTDAGVVDRTDVRSLKDRLLALPAGEWTPEDLAAANAVQRLAGADPSVSTYRNRVLQLLLDHQMVDLGPSTPRHAQALQSTWAHPDRASATRRMLELAEAEGRDIDPARWREIHALLYDVPRDVRVEVPGLSLPDEASNVVAGTRLYFPGFGDFHVYTGIRMATRETSQVAMQLAAAGTHAPKAFRDEFANTMADARLVQIRTALDPGYLDRVRGDLRAALDAGRHPATTGHPGPALSLVGIDVLHDVPLGLETARRAAKLAEVTAGDDSLPFWTELGRQVDIGAFAAMPPIETQVQTLVDRSIGLIDGTIVNGSWYNRAADYADLGRVQSLIETVASVDDAARAAALRAAPDPAVATW